ncbi:Vitamin B12 transporter BtuB precursor [Microbulbifer aggregans]|uniref:Vitamin B12 transporter BtuB n=2 Tax=Microbulbifer aggregans TaxID=1769779 RepID=A0A1C9W9S1_9GAMM|nr:Vitamin B12 transporter BtuB precursor [Microbulbifer aggregans]
MRRITGILMLLLSQAAQADDVDLASPGEASGRLETMVVTASPMAAGSGGYGGSLSLLGGDDLSLLNHSHIQQALVRVPGANVSRGNGQEYLPALRSPVLTGAGACGSILVMQDNIPLFPAGFCNINELLAAHTEQAARIEVIRGPAGTLHGAGAMHGVINVVGPAARSSEGTSARVQGGPEDRWKLDLRSNGRALGESEITSALSLAHDGGYLSQSGLDQQKLSLVFRSAETGDETRLTATNLEQETAGYIVGEDVYRDSSLRRTNPDPEAFRNVRTARLSHRLKRVTGSGYVVDLTPYVRWGDMAFLQHFLPGQPLEETGYRSAGFRANIQAEVADSTRVTVGLDGELTGASLHQSQRAPASGSDFLRETLPVGRHYDYHVEAGLLSPFALVALSPSEGLTVEAGVRLEALRYDYDNRLLPGRTREDGSECGFGGCRYSRPDDRSDDFFNWSPHLGLVYEWTPQQQVFVNLAHGFRAPQATELYRLQREQSVADLDSEELRSVEIGLRGDRERWHYELVGFGMEKRNVIFRDADFFNRSGAATSHQGVEIALGYRLTAQWALDMNASYAEHRYRDDRLLDGVALDGKLVDSAPRVFGSARLRWLPDEQSSVELEWLHLGRYYTDPLNLHSYPGHDLLNLRAQRDLGAGWSVALRLLNILDEWYAERADFSNFGGDRYFPGEPRSVYGEVALRF